MATPEAIRAGLMLMSFLVTPGMVAAERVPVDPQAATGLRAVTDCDDAASGDSTARLAWSAAQSAGEQQRVAVTVVRDGFEREDTELSEPLAAEATKFMWKPKRLRTPHFWRVLTRHGETWVPSQTARFSPARCNDMHIPTLLPPSGGAAAGTEGPIPPAPRW